MNLKDKNIVIVGLGKSGISSAKFLAGEGAKVTVTDMSDKDSLHGAVTELTEYEVRFELGYHDEETFNKADIIIISPGVPHTIKPVQDAVKKGVTLMGEIELAARFISKPVIAITGTNGKSTVTALAGEMLNRSGIRSAVCGNIGIPMSDFINNTETYDVLVLEVSSFQLDTITSFKPYISVLLNISDDHLDRYHDINHYADSKARIFMNQTREDHSVINSGDDLIQKYKSNIKSSILTFGCENRHDAEIDKSRITLFKSDPDSFVINLSKTHLKGPHNRENIAAAALAALKAGATPEGIQNAVDSFRSLPHRVEFVDKIKGVNYYNDSKGTNTDSVLKAVESFNDLILIMGGREKDCNYSILKNAVQERVKKLILLGEAQKNIASELGDSADVIMASDMVHAVEISYKLAEPGDTVLLSPACTSFDMFKNYAERGQTFKNAVNKVSEK